MFSRKPDKALKPLLDHYTSDALASMSKHGKVISITPGQVFFEEGKGGNEVAVVVEGAAKVMQGTKMLNVLREGDLVGEIAVLSGEPRNASVQAATLLKLLVLDSDGFSRTLDTCEAFRAKVLAGLEERAA